MSAIRIAGVAAAALVISTAGVAQTSSDTHAKSAKAGMTTVTGCLMKETEYRSAHGLGKGKLRGAGLGDEYVIVESADCSNTASGMAYRPTGPREKDMKSLLGQRVEVTGTLRHAVTKSDQLPQEIVVSSFSAAPAAPSGEAYNAAPASEPSASESTNASTEPPAPSLEARNNTSPDRRPVGTSGLPRTAGEEPLIGLIGLISLGAGIGLKMLRNAIA